MTTAFAFICGMAVGQVALLAGLYLAVRSHDAQDARQELRDPDPTLTLPPFSLRRSTRRL